MLFRSYLAANAFLTTSQMTWENGGLLDERDLSGFHAVSDTTGLDTLPVAGINMAALPNMNYAAFDIAVAYAAGDMVTYEGGVYVFKATHAAGAWSTAHVIKINQAISQVDIKNATNEKSE